MKTFNFFIMMTFLCLFTTPHAQDVQLQFGGYVKDGLNGVDGLYSANKVVISPDGKDIYTTSDYDDAVSWFSRNTQTGVLTYGGGLIGPLVSISNFISPDGKNVYVVGEEDGVIRCYSRDTTTGALTSQGDAQVNNQNGLYNGMVSPDGRHVYVPSMNYYSINWLNRDTTTGVLTYAGQIVDNQGGANQLSGAYSVLVSPDGKYVYVSACYDLTISVFARNQTNGILTYRSAVHYGIKNDQYMICGAYSFAASSDGKYLYVTDPADSLVSWFSRDTSTGALTPLGSLHDGQGGVDGLLLASEISVSQDGRRVYVGAYGDNSLSWFDRDQVTGSLTYRECFKNGQNSITHMRGAASIALSPDDRYIYVAAAGDSAISWFTVNSISVNDHKISNKPTDRYHLTIFKDEIKFIMPDQTMVTLYFADLKGNRVASLVKNQYLPAGSHEVNFKTNLLPSGLYVCVLETAMGSIAKKFIIAPQQ